MPLEVLEQCLALNPYIPKLPHPKQIEFLELECREALYGGAASGGKSEGLLMAALMFVHVPNYAALIVRRNFSDLKLPGGLIDRSIEWLKGKAHWNAQEHRWRFKEGSTIQFGYCDKEGDERRYDGTEFQYVGLDEGCHFTEKQIVFFSTERIRKRDDIPVPLRFRIGTTPGGVGHDFIKRRYVKPGTPGAGFIPATVFDNPSVDSVGYMTSLAGLKETNPLRYRQMLMGDWDAVEGGRFKREWFGWWRTERGPGGPEQMVLSTYGGEEVERFSPATCSRLQTCDPAASTSKAADYFVLSTWLVTPRANVVWWGCHRGKHEIQEQLSTTQRLYRRYKPQFIAVEEVLNQRALSQLARRSTSPVMVVRAVSPMGRDKLNRATGFIALTASKRVFVPESPAPDWPLDDVMDEVVRFTGDDEKDTHDDTVDTGSMMTDMLPYVRNHQSQSAGKPFFRYESKQTIV